MRILTIGNLYPPHHFGGYERVWQGAVASLRDHGHEVRVLATEYRHPDYEDAGDELQVYRQLRWYWREHEFARFRPLERLRLERHNHAVLRAHLADLQPDVVSFWAMGGMSHTLIEDVRRREIPMVAFVHDLWLGYGRVTDQWLRLFGPRRRRAAAAAAARLTGIPTRVDYGRAGQYVFVSEHLRRRALPLNLGLTDTAVASSGIDSLFFGDAPERPWRWRLLYVGRLHPDKGIHEAVTALKALPADAEMTFAGSWDPREEAALEETIKRLRLRGRVRLRGQLRPERIADLYRGHDVLLFPVLWEEPWGLVPLEAMACGCPVVATGRGGSGEYLEHGSNCLLVPSGDPAGLAAAVRELAASAPLRRRITRRGLDTARNHTAARFNEAVEHHLEQAAGGRSAPAPALA